MADRAIASAVVLPEPLSPSPPRRPSPSPPSTLVGSKRRQSSISHDSPKRQRLSPSPDRRRKESHGSETAVTSQLQRPVKPIDERKRNQRLFGALLGSATTQSRPSNAAASKRRAEQEDRRRQKEQELSERQKSRLEALAQARKLEQRRVDETNMRIRHDNMRAMANFLITTSEPKLYYRPWELLPEHQEQIDRQREDVDAQIDQELDDFDQVRQTWTQDDDQGQDNGLNHLPSEQTQAEPRHVDHPRAPASINEAADAPMPKLESVSVSEPIDEPTRHLRDHRATHDSERQRKESIDMGENDIVVEADEDTVIY